MGQIVRANNDEDQVRAPLQDCVDLLAQIAAARTGDGEHLVLNCDTARLQRFGQSAVRKYPGTSFASSANRFGVSSWDEWFPARGLVSECFLSLTAARPADVSHAPWLVTGPIP